MILQANSIEIPLADESVNCCITSPPYWSLRDYQIQPHIWDGNGKCKHEWQKRTFKQHSGRGDCQKSGKYSEQDDIPDKVLQDSFCSLCGAWRGSLGLEPTFELYLEHLWQVFDEVKRVLRKDGCIFVNIGDTYAGSQCGYGQTKESTGFQNIARQTYYPTTSKKPPKLDYPDKSLCLIPFRFAIGMVERGWILRNTLIWHKPNCMPSSVKDRYTVDFEYVFFFSKNKKYWFEQQFEPHAESTLRDIASGCKSGRPYKKAHLLVLNGTHSNGGIGDPTKTRAELSYPQGRNKRCVWRIPTSPFKEAHFATFPPALVEPMIRSGCPEFVCKRCGKAREKIYKPVGEYAKHLGSDWRSKSQRVSEKSTLITGNSIGWKGNKELKELGLSDCGCNAGWDAGICLDPFIGSGTTAVVAKELGRRCIGLELNAEYCKMAQRRINAVPERLKI